MKYRWGKVDNFGGDRLIKRKKRWGHQLYVHKQIRLDGDVTGVQVVLVQNTDACWLFHVIVKAIFWSDAKPPPPAAIATTATDTTRRVNQQLQITLIKYRKKNNYFIAWWYTICIRVKRIVTHLLDKFFRHVNINKGCFPNLGCNTEQIISCFQANRKK